MGGLNNLRAVLVAEGDRIRGVVGSSAGVGEPMVDELDPEWRLQPWGRVLPSTRFLG